MSTIAAIVLAAGRGSRFGERPKLLAPIGGEPMVRRPIRAALAAGLSPVLLVVGHHAAEIRGAVEDLPVQVIPNPAYEDGLSTSLKAGFTALPPIAEAALVLLGDMPGIGPDLIRSVVDGWISGGRPDAAIPTRNGQRGNPVLLSVRLAPEIVRLTGDAGAGALLRSRDHVVEVSIGSDAVMLDVDTPAALAAFPDQLPASTTPSRMAE